MRKSKKLAILIIRKYRHEESLSRWQIRFLERCKNKSVDNQIILDQLVDIFNEKVELPVNPFKNIEAILSKINGRAGTDTLSEEELELLNQWRGSAPENEERFAWIIQPDKPSLDVRLTRKELRQMTWIKYRVLIINPLLMWLGFSPLGEERKPVSEKTVDLIVQVLERRNLV
jgi:hypothetical protein